MKKELQEIYDKLGRDLIELDNLALDLALDKGEKELSDEVDKAGDKIVDALEMLVETIDKIK